MALLGGKRFDSLAARFSNKDDDATRSRRQLSTPARFVLAKPIIEMHWTMGGLVVFLLYATAAVQSRRTSLALSDSLHATESLIWNVTAGLFCILAINLALGGLDRLATAVRADAQAMGWYGRRAPVQTDLTITALIMCAALASLGLVLLGSLPTPSKLAFVVLLALIGFLCVRAISLHAVDHVLYARVLGVTVSTAVEAGLITLVVVLVCWRQMAVR